jgi:hypothetical protein
MVKGSSVLATRKNIVLLKKITLRMKGAGEISNCGFLVKEDVLDAKIPHQSDLKYIHPLWEECKEFWCDDSTKKLQAIRRLIARLDEEMEEAKRNRKRTRNIANIH